MKMNKYAVIDDRWLFSHGKSQFLPNQPFFLVEEVDGEYTVVVKYYNESMRSIVTGSVVGLDENNQFQPDGMRWKFTVTDDGFLTWEEVSK